ncbi:MAG: class I SAM-dependent methyltransferase, partial [Dehalococcoidia bacterium]|nr:class I SAM-dependent methyltransferase [Dehalococcoidia bacterium]
MTTIDYLRYLTAKRNVDDRAINDGVYRRLDQTLSTIPAERTLRVVEIGCGVGTMIERLLDWQLDATRAASPRWRYVAIDERPEHVAAARARVASLGQRDLWQWEPTEDGGALHSPWRADHFAFVAAPFAHWANSQPDSSADFVVACAVLDIVDRETTLSTVTRLLAPGGVLWCPITFDGLTAFDPPVDPTVDREVVAIYHRTMDERPTRGGHGGSEVGRTLWRACARAGLTPLALGGSTWVVAPEDGDYPDDDAFFLHTILDFIHLSVGATGRLRKDTLDSWIATRRRQLVARELVFLA